MKIYNIISYIMMPLLLLILMLFFHNDVHSFMITSSTTTSTNYIITSEQQQRQFPYCGQRCSIDSNNNNNNMMTFVLFQSTNDENDNNDNENDTPNLFDYFDPLLSPHVYKKGIIADPSLLEQQKQQALLSGIEQLHDFGLLTSSLQDNDDNDTSEKYFQQNRHGDFVVDPMLHQFIQSTMEDDIPSPPPSTPTRKKLKSLLDIQEEDDEYILKLQQGQDLALMNEENDKDLFDYFDPLVSPHNYPKGIQPKSSSTASTVTTTTTKKKKFGLKVYGVDDIDNDDDNNKNDNKNDDDNKNNFDLFSLSPNDSNPNVKSLSNHEYNNINNNNKVKKPRVGLRLPSDDDDDKLTLEDRIIEDNNDNNDIDLLDYFDPLLSPHAYPKGIVKSSSNNNNNMKKEKKRSVGLNLPSDDDSSNINELSPPQGIVVKEDDNNNDNVDLFDYLISKSSSSSSSTKKKTRVGLRLPLDDDDNDNDDIINNISRGGIVQQEQQEIMKETHMITKTVEVTTPASNNNNSSDNTPVTPINDMNYNVTERRHPKKQLVATSDWYQTNQRSKQQQQYPDSSPRTTILLSNQNQNQQQQQKPAVNGMGFGFRTPSSSSSSTNMTTATAVSQKATRSTVTEEINTETKMMTEQTLVGDDVHTTTTNYTSNNKIGILLIDHGSRNSMSNRRLQIMSKLYKKHIIQKNNHNQTYIVRGSHMEIAKPSIEDGILSLLRSNVTEIICTPYFLSPGRHVIRDIPQIIHDIKEKYQFHNTISITITDPIGSNTDLMIQSIDQSIQQTQKSS